MPIPRDPRITPRVGDQLLDPSSGSTLTVIRTYADGAVVTHGGDGEQFYAVGAWKRWAATYQVVHATVRYAGLDTALLTEAITNMEARKVARVAAETLAAERTGDDDYADKLTDAAVRVAHIACDLLDSLDPCDAGDVFTVLGEDVAPLRIAIREWKAAGEAFLGSLRSARVALVDEPGERVPGTPFNVPNPAPEALLT